MQRSGVNAGMPSGPADVDSRDESEVSPEVETEGTNTCGLSSVASCTRGANVTSCVRLFVDPGLFPVSNGKVADFISTHPWGKVRVRTTSMGC